MTRQGEVLVAILNNRADMAIAQEQHWYRIPVSSVEKFLKRRWPPEWLAFYQTSVFGNEKYTVNFCAKVLDITICDRCQLFPLEPPNAKSHKRYCKLILSPLQKLPQPIVSHRQRRITFIPTTLHKLTTAAEINDLYDDSPLEDQLWQACKSLQINAERQERIKIKHNIYFLDFAIYCVRGNINVEADGDRWHSDRQRIPLDNLRDNDLGTLGWRTLRFNTTQVQEQMGHYCIPTVVENIDRLGGLIQRSSFSLPEAAPQYLKSL
jgi:very-short-patch-repair endonuclease